MQLHRLEALWLLRNWAAYLCWNDCFCFLLLLVTNQYEYAYLDFRKGPPERAQFPAFSSVVSPYQQLGQFILVLGRKIDSAQELKDLGRVVPLQCRLNLVSCLLPFVCLLSLLRKNSTSMRTAMPKPRSLNLKLIL